MDYEPLPEPTKEEVELSDEAQGLANNLLFAIIALYVIGGVTVLAAFGEFLVLALVGGAVTAYVLYKLFMISAELDDLMSAEEDKEPKA